MKNKEIGPFQVYTAKLTLKSFRIGTFTLKPQAVYVDDSGKIMTCNLRPVTITVIPRATNETGVGKISTGTSDLDRLLSGGIPENYAIILVSPSSDERATLVKRFLDSGSKAGEATVYVTVDAGNARTLATEHPFNFQLLICNLQADAMIEDFPNVSKLKGVENLTEIEIALTKALRTLNPPVTSPKRICLEIVSDVLMQHHAIIARKWLSTLLPSLRSRGFTVLAVINPVMHSQEESQAIISLFDGEIHLYERETAKGIERILRVRRLLNQKYLENELTVTGEKLD